MWDTKRRQIPWWAAASAVAAPLLLTGGFVVAAALQPASYSPIRDTISSLGAQSATDPWVMTMALVGVGTCYLLTALGLRPARRLGRIALAGGGAATLLIAVFRQPLHGYSTSHGLAVVAACTAMCTWPPLAAHRRHRAPLLTLVPCVTAAAMTFGLTLWFAFENHGGEVGLAERCAAVAAALWLSPVVLSTRRALASPPVPDGQRDTPTLAVAPLESVPDPEADSKIPAFVHPRRRVRITRRGDSHTRTSGHSHAER